MASRRLLREYNEQKKNKEEDLTLVPDENNIFAWTARIDGPKDTPFEGGNIYIWIKLKYIRCI